MWFQVSPSNGPQGRGGGAASNFQDTYLFWYIVRTCFVSPKGTVSSCTCDARDVPRKPILQSESGSLGIESGSLGIESGSLGMESGSLGIESGSLGMESGSLGMESGSLGIESGSLGMESGSLGIESGSLGIESGSLGIESGSLGIESGSLGMEFGSLGIESGSLGMSRTLHYNYSGSRTLTPPPPLTAKYSEPPPTPKVSYTCTEEPQFHEPQS